MTLDTREAPSANASDAPRSRHPDATAERMLGHRRLLPGDEFLFGADGLNETLWGDQACTLWAVGEALAVFGGIGSAKTTLAGLLVRARMGLADSVLGMPVAPGDRRVLYLAMDRPKQIRRSMRRQFSPSEQAVAHDRLLVWEGPPLGSIIENPRLLSELADHAEADTVVVDSSKDIGVELEKGPGGQAFNTARQHMVADGIEVLELHHARKAGNGGRDRLALDDFYGSVNLSAGVGTALALSKQTSEGFVRMEAVKTSGGAFDRVVRLDHARGAILLDEQPSVLDVIGDECLTVAEVAQAIYGEGYDRTTKERVRRELVREADAGTLVASERTIRGNKTAYYCRPETASAIDERNNPSLSTPTPAPWPHVSPC